MRGGGDEEGDDETPTSQELAVGTLGSSCILNRSILVYEHNMLLVVCLRMYSGMFSEDVCGIVFLRSRALRTFDLKFGLPSVSSRAAYSRHLMLRSRALHLARV